MLSPSGCPNPTLSILIPVFNEQLNIAAVIEEVLGAIEGQNMEVIVIDDGSDDGTADAARTLAGDGVPLTVISHQKRSGKSAALRTGAIAARALWVGTMDGDGQDDPQDLLNMASKVDLTETGEVGLVGGVRQQRTDGTSRKWVSRLGNGIRKRVLRDNCPDTACGLKVLQRDIFLAFPFFDALHRYLPAFTQSMGLKAIYEPVTNRPRAHGSSKYTNIGRAAAGAVDLMGVAWLLRRASQPGAVHLSRVPSATKTEVA